MMAKCIKSDIYIATNRKGWRICKVKRELIWK